MQAASEAVERIVGRIQTVRGLRVLLDADLAALYGVSTKQFNQAVRRNSSKFPSEFAFQLTTAEFETLRSQTVTSNVGRGGRRHLPQVFTEYGALMASTILNSPRAVEVSVYVIRAFVQLRDLLAGNKELSHRLDDLERHITAKFARQNAEIADILSAIRQLVNPPNSSRRRIGF